MCESCNDNSGKGGCVWHGFSRWHGHRVCSICCSNAQDGRRGRAASLSLRRDKKSNRPVWAWRRLYPPYDTKGTHCGVSPTGWAGRHHVVVVWHASMRTFVSSLAVLETAQREWWRKLGMHAICLLVTAPSGQGQTLKDANRMGPSATAPRHRRLPD